VQNLTGYLF